jgi:hypothetical protein
MWVPNTVNLIDAWDRGARASNAERALVLLATVWPEQAEQLAMMPLGWINAQLLELRHSLIGPMLECLSDCSQCGTSVECEVAIEQLTAIAAGKAPEASELRSLQLEHDGYTIEFRLPTCGDLLAIRGDPKAAAPEFVQRLIGRVARHGDAIAPVDMPTELHMALEHAVIENDPLAHVELGLQCPGCGHRWMEALDVIDFVWRELSLFAQRLLLDVAQLAYAFGWREADILAMSDHRRRCYLELLPI